MRALRFHAQRDLRIEEVAEPVAPTGEEVLLDIIYCGICGTDVHEYNSGPIILPVKPHPVSGAALPIILGHEFSAVVAEVGPEVSTVQPGERVAILPHLMMKDDYFVRRNLGQFSPNTGLVGLTWHWGGMGQRAMVPADNLVKLPDNVTDIQGAMLEPTAVAINAIDETRFSAGQTMLVVGAGPIGALTALAARAAGASKVYIYDPNEARLAHLAKFPEFSVFCGDPGEILSIIADETEAGTGVDVAVECAGHSSALDLCIEATKRTGHVALVGLITGRTPVDLFKVCEKGLRVIGCWGNDFTLGSRLVAMIESGRLPVESLVTGIVTLDRAISDGFDVLSEAQNDHLKILIDMRA
ncbi:MAG: (R,R)-butanediol dehydrogenase/meso-butanediol dehydrogenase/diacetyl reductase [Granulosicoccus sp.]|jgi:(R,R)-butanediol dehydrogenase/meso-butanediol dehydrogenase/diacetyl reductase